MRRFLSNYGRLTGITVLIISAVLLLQSTVLAQQTGTITGTVFDTTGAVVPGAKIVLQNQATKDIRQTISNGEGFFTFAGVMPGNYDAKVEMAGFKSWVLNGIKISPGDRRNISNIDLAVGAANDSITVDATATQVAVVDSGERSATLTSKDIRTLALQGRDVTELTKVLPGFNNFTGNGGNLANRSGYNATVTGIGSSVGNGYSANGSPDRGGTDLISDGAHVIDPGCNCNATQTINADMVEEVKVQSSNFGADNAKGPVVINAVGKSGSSAYHGEAYLHFRDSAANSNDWEFNKRGLDKPKDRYWYPGGNFGGPVKVPGTNLDKKMFFWSGYEYYNQKFPERDGILKAIVPTLGMRNGDFSANGEGNAQLCSTGGWLPQCELTGGHLPDGTAIPEAWGGVLPQNVLDPGGMAIMKMIPLPNADPSTNGGFNYVKPQIATRNGWMFRNRVDYNFSENSKLYVSYNLQREISSIPVMLWWQPPQSVEFPGGAAQRGDSHTVSVNFLHVFSPSLTNEFIGTWTRYSNPGIYNNPAAVSREALGYPYKGVFDAGTDVMPALSNGWWIPGYPMIYQADMANYQAVKFMPTLSDNLTKVIGRHTFKTGVYWEITGNKQGTVDYQNGRIQFAPMGWAWNATDNPVANMLLGVSSNFYQVNKNVETDLNYKSLSFYVQDSWKVTERLTLDLGIRFEHSPAWTDATGDTGLAIWTRERYLADIAAGVSELPGMTWHGKDSSVPLSGREVTPILFSPRVGLAWDIFGKGNTILRGGFGTYRWRDQYNDYAGALSTALGTRSFETYNPTSLKDFDNMTVAGGLASTVYAVDPTDDMQPLTYTYNLTISQKTAGDSLLEVAYVGNQSSQMMTPLLNQNIIPLGAYFGPDPVTGKIAASAHDADQVKSHYRPYSAYNELNIYKHEAYSNYNALQVSWTRPRGAFTYGFNYTFSKALGIEGKADPINLDANYSVLKSDRTHVFNSSYSYDFGRPWHGNSIVGGFLNGWMISGITSLQSGPNMQNAYDRGFRINGPESTLNGHPVQANNVNILGTPDYTLIPMLTCDPREGVGAGQVLTNCFALPAVGGNENGPISMPYIHGPAFFNSDVSVQKNFKIGERQNVQFRLSAFNFLNHPLRSFDNDDDDNIKAQFNFDGTRVYPRPGNIYGVPYLKHGRRILEFTLRYSF